MIDEIKNNLPHRYPFLLVDRVLDYTVDEQITAIKNVTINEEFFNGHFPQKPVMPGVLMVEALAQVAGILVMQSMALQGEKPDDNLFLFAGIDNARFKRMVVPGDQLTFDVSVIKKKSRLWKFKGVASVEGELACEAEFMVIKE